MATTATTFGAIRDKLVTTIQDLTPARLAHELFRYAPRVGVEYLSGTDLRGWAEDNDGSCFRLFDITVGTTAPAGMSDEDIQREEAVLEVVLCYPVHLAKYGSDNSGEMADFMEQDIRQIRASIGVHGAANWVSGATPKLPEDVSYEDGEGVRFAVLRLGCEYYYDT